MYIWYVLILYKGSINKTPLLSKYNIIIFYLEIVFSFLLFE